MKKTLIIMALFALAFVPMAQAEVFHNTLNAEFDAPHLVGLKQISPDLWLGASVEKPMATNLFYSSFAGVEDDQAYLITAKITFEGCIINCPEK